jgi:hypothetical protein
VTVDCREPVAILRHSSLNIAVRQINRQMVVFIEPGWRFVCTLAEDALIFAKRIFGRLIFSV